jgi:hypothetical protein
MKSRKAGRGTRRAAQGAGRTAPALAPLSEPQPTRLERDDEIRLRRADDAEIGRLKTCLPFTRSTHFDAMASAAASGCTHSVSARQALKEASLECGVRS